ncbi:MAG: hypothetical protein HDQ99_19750 [Lachnospiraceae bacterium]|nr:hypothetical protein [Lachnospiraceae bacterium]
MKKSAIYVWMIPVILFGVIILGIIAKFSPKKVDSMRTDKVGGLIATWKYVEREINLECYSYVLKMKC